MSDVVIVRLITGVEVIGALQQETGEIIELKNAFQLRIVPNKANSQTINVALGQFVPLADGASFTFYKTALLGAPYKPAKEIEDNYRANFKEDSGIVVVGGLITG